MYNINKKKYIFLCILSIYKVHISVYNNINKSNRAQNKNQIQEVSNMTTNNTITIEKAWDTLLEMGVSEQTLQIVTSINGYNMKTLENVLYAYAGYNSFDQL